MFGFVPMFLPNGTMMILPANHNQCHTAMCNNLVIGCIVISLMALVGIFGFMIYDHYRW